MQLLHTHILILPLLIFIPYFIVTGTKAKGPVVLPGLLGGLVLGKEPKPIHILLLSFSFHS